MILLGFAKQALDLPFSFHESLSECSRPLASAHDKVYTVVISDAKAKTLVPIIREKVKPDSIVYTDRFRGYNALDVSEFTH